MAEENAAVDPEPAVAAEPDLFDGAEPAAESEPAPAAETAEKTYTQVELQQAMKTARDHRDGEWQAQLANQPAVQPVAAATESDPTKTPEFEVARGKFSQDEDGQNTYDAVLGVVNAAMAANGGITSEESKEVAAQAASDAVGGIQADLGIQAEIARMVKDGEITGEGGGVLNERYNTTIRLPQYRQMAKTPDGATYILNTLFANAVKKGDIQTHPPRAQSPLQPSGPAGTPAAVSTPKGPDMEAIASRFPSLQGITRNQLAAATKTGADNYKAANSEG